MKKIVSLMLLTVLCLSFLVSCGGGIPNGTYTNTLAGDMEINGNKMIVSTKLGDETYSVVSTYKLNGDKDEITITFDKVEYDGDSETVKGIIADMEKEMEKEDSKSQTIDIELGEDSFTLVYSALNKVKYTKK